MATITSLRAQLSQMVRYRRTVAELRALPSAVREDLDILGREDSVARSAIYG